jgi:beta-lactamase regulating signal transducer with metallopeptidase domain
MNEVVESVLGIALGNAAVATGLLAVAWLVRRLDARPAWVHALCVLALLEHVVPPLWVVPVLPQLTAPDAPSAATAGAVSADDAAPAAASPAMESIADAPRTAGTPALAMPEVAVPAVAAADTDPTRPPTVAATSAFATFPWWTAAALAWAAGTVLVLARAALRARAFAHTLAAAEGVDAGVEAAGRRIAASLGLRRCPPVRVVDAQVAPMLCVVGGRLRIVLPRPLLARLDADGRDALLAHELTHLRRGDHLVRVLELVASAAYWWLPTLRPLRRLLRATEEECCDLGVLRDRPRSARSYADTLLDAVDFLAERPPAAPPVACGIGDVHDLKKRLTMIMTRSTPVALGARGRTLTFAFALCLLPVAPTFAQQEPRRADQGTQEEIRQLRAELQELRAALKQNMAESRARQDEGRARQDEARARRDAEANAQDMHGRLADVMKVVEHEIRSNLHKHIPELHRDISQALEHAGRAGEVVQESLKGLLQNEELRNVLTDEVAAELKRAMVQVSKEVEGAMKEASRELDQALEEVDHEVGQAMREVANELRSALRESAAEMSEAEHEDRAGHAERADRAAAERAARDAHRHAQQAEREGRRQAENADRDARRQAEQAEREAQRARDEGGLRRREAEAERERADRDRAKNAELEDRVKSEHQAARSAELESRLQQMQKEIERLHRELEAERARRR